MFERVTTGKKIKLLSIFSISFGLFVLSFVQRFHTVGLLLSLVGQCAVWFQLYQIKKE